MADRHRRPGIDRGDDRNPGEARGRSLETGDRPIGGDVLAARLPVRTDHGALDAETRRGGLIARVRKGLYLVPPKLPLGGGWTPGELEALAALMADAGARYQVCGPSAFNRHGFDEQIPNRLYAYNTRLSGTRKIGALQLTLIKVSQSRLGETEKIKVPGQG